ncbi:MAG: tetratricopeptide repeat protein [Weeksellaceae bacterium]
MIQEGVEQLHLRNHSKSLEILTLVKATAKENQWFKQEFLAVNNIGVNYYLMLDYGEALDNYLDAYKIAIKDLESKYEMIVLNNIAILYSKEKQFEKAEEYFKKAYDIAVENNDSLKIGLYTVNLATQANEQNEINKAEAYLNTASRYPNNDPLVFYQAKITHAQLLILKEDFENAKKILYEVLPELNSPELSELRIASYMLLSSVYKCENEIENAIKYANRAISDRQSSIENKIEAYEKLAEIYRSSARNELAFQYKDSMMWAKDSLNQVKNGKLFENSRIKFELQNYQQKLSESQKRLNAERKLFYTIIDGIIALILITLWAIRNHYVKLRQRKIIAENNQKIAELELEMEKSDKLILEQKLGEQSTRAMLEKERFKNEIEAKNRQLASKALTISARNELLENIIEALSRESEIRGNENLRKRIFELKNHLKKESEWDEFFMHFEETNYGFLSSLKEKHNDLTSNDIRFLSYLYMNLSTKEISSLLNITVEACRKRKERIIKKMNLPEETNLYDYLSSF